MECPKCHIELHNGATYCGCGWRRRPTNSQEFHENPHIQCAHESCRQSAMHKVNTKTGWANLCDHHYDAYYRQQAIDNLDKYGMELQPDETRAEHVQRMRAFVKDGIRRMAKGGGRMAAIRAMESFRNAQESAEGNKT